MRKNAAELASRWLKRDIAHLSEAEQRAEERGRANAAVARHQPIIQRPSSRRRPPGRLDRPGRRLVEASSSASSSSWSSGRSPMPGCSARKLRSLSLHLPQPAALDARRPAGAGHHDVAEPAGRARPHRCGARLRGQPQGRDRDHGAAREARRTAPPGDDRRCARRSGGSPKSSRASSSGSADGERAG